MEAPQEPPAAPRVRLFERAELFNLHPDCLAEVTSETPYFQERYEDAVAAFERSLAGDGEAIDRTKLEKKVRDARARVKR